VGLPPCGFTGANMAKAKRKSERMPTPKPAPPPPPAPHAVSPAEAVRVVKEAAKAVGGWAALRELVDVLAEE